MLPIGKIHQQNEFSIKMVALLSGGGCRFGSTAVQDGIHKNLCDYNQTKSLGASID